ncbi:MAG: methyltransferase domain-containing protein, partial [Ruegeria sp.]
IEPNESMAKFANEKMDLNVLQGDLETVQDLDPFDAISMIQVIGHFHDLRRSLDTVSKLTQPGALCLIEFWRRESMIARLFGKHWHEYSPPSVLHWFTSKSLDFAMNERGFENLAAGAPRKYISGAHAASLLTHKMSSVPGHKIVTSPLRSMFGKSEIPYPPLDLQWRLYRRA